VTRRARIEPITPATTKKLRCAVYTRKSTDEGLEKEFNTLDAQRDSCEAYVTSQRAEGWVLVRDRYDDEGFSGGTLERPALQRLLRDIQADLVDVIVVYKIDRLSRSLMDFAKLVEVMDAHGVTFVSVTQSFNTTTSMGRLTLNILLSFAQFEREVIGERIRDKFAASRARGMWMGGKVPLGYNVVARKLIVNEDEAPRVRRVAPVTTRADPALVKALARAFRYQRMLDEGRYASISEMAAAEQIERGYLGGLLRLTLLAPDILDTILDGRGIDELTLPRLMEPVPISWTEQRGLFSPPPTGTAPARR